MYIFAHVVEGWPATQTLTQKRIQTQDNKQMRAAELADGGCISATSASMHIISVATHARGS